MTALKIKSLTWSFFSLFTWQNTGNFLENDFWTPPPSYQFNVRRVAAALGPLACPGPEIVLT